MLSHLALLLAAAIWGFAFVAQRKGMESLDPLTFNALRFAVGAVCVWLFRFLPVLFRPANDDRKHPRLQIQKGSLLLGLLLFCASTLQQVGMLWTGAGSAGFITGLYVVFVPLIGLFRGQKPRRRLTAAVLLSLAGLALINNSLELEATLGNSLVLLGAMFWALHVQLIDKLTRQHPSLDLALAQYAVCAALSLAGSVVFRSFQPGGALVDPKLLDSINSALLPILYAGVMSVGIAFTLQLWAQKRIQPQAASIILCLEAVFALLGGFLLLREEVSLLSLAGAACLLAAMLVSVLGERRDFLIDKKGGSQT